MSLDGHCLVGNKRMARWEHWANKETKFILPHVVCSSCGGVVLFGGERSGGKM